MYLMNQVMQGVPTDYELEDLSRNIGAKWDNLGRRLNFSDEELQEIDSDKRLLSQKAFQMLKEWKKRNGSGATYQTLCAALSHRFVSRTDLAEKYDNCDDQEPPGHASQQPLTRGSGSSQTEWPSDKELQQIANRIASHWEEIGIFLGIANDQIQRIKIRERNAPFQMLVAWKKNIKCVHPYKTLYDALCSEGVDLSNVADEFLLGKI